MNSARRVVFARLPHRTNGDNGSWMGDGPIPRCGRTACCEDISIGLCAAVQNECGRFESRLGLIVWGTRAVAQARERKTVSHSYTYAWPSTRSIDL